MNSQENSATAALHHEMMRVAHQWDHLYGRWARSQGASLNTLLLYDYLQKDTGVSPRDIALSCRIPKQTLTGILRELDQRGEITFATNPNDARGKLVYLTEKGCQRRAELLGSLHGAEQRALAAMGEEQAQRLVESTTAFLAQLEQHLNLTPHHPSTP